MSYLLKITLVFNKRVCNYESSLKKLTSNLVTNKSRLKQSKSINNVGNYDKYSARYIIKTETKSCPTSGLNVD